MYTRPVAYHTPRQLRQISTERQTLDLTATKLKERAGSFDLQKHVPVILQ